MAYLESEIADWRLSVGYSLKLVNRSSCPPAKSHGTANISLLKSHHRIAILFIVDLIADFLVDNGSFREQMRPQAASCSLI